MDKGRFRNENLISGAHYDDGLAVDCPPTRTFIVSDRERLNSIFVSGIAELEVDFDCEMLIVYTFASEYVATAKITNIELSDKTLTVAYGIELVSGTGGAVRPFQRWFVVKLTKLDITSVNNSVLFVNK